MQKRFVLKCLIFFLPFFGISSVISFVIESFEKWPLYNKFGEISAVSVDSYGNVYVFHRADRKWDEHSFSESNIFLDIYKGPISNKTLVLLNPDSGSLLKKTGENKFYLPHGLTVDHKDNVWVTDVALHQVFKFPPIATATQLFVDLEKPSLTLGVEFEPGNDNNHFCKPTDVAIDKQTNDFYVSDGYCNSRIIKYNQYGTKLLSWGRSSIGNPDNNLFMLNVPHSLTLAQDEKVLYVADRENYRVIPFNSDSGELSSVLAEELKSRIYSVAYSEIKGGIVFVLSQSKIFKAVSIFSSKTKKFLFNFFPKHNFTNPHDIAIDSKSQHFYVVELNPHKIWKFVIRFLNSSEKEDNNLEGKNRINQFNESNLYLATFLIFLIISVSFVFFIFHLYKSKQGRKWESKKLILSDNDNEESHITIHLI